jgi:hypothetical protein
MNNSKLHKSTSTASGGHSTLTELTSSSIRPTARSALLYRADFIVHPSDSQVSTTLPLQLHLTDSSCRDQKHHP